MSGIDYRDAATGLRITDEPHANGIGARAVYRGDERIYHGKPVGVGYFLKGYGACKAEPIEALLEDPRISDVHVLEAAQSILADRGQDTESLAVAIESLKPTRCTLCRCEATDAVYGFEVCGYHVDHTEDDPPCPRCAADAEQLEDGRQLLAEQRDMTQGERDALPVHVGDRVRDPFDGAWRTVKRIEGGTTVYLEDGGCMGIDECREIRLPSEDLD